LVSPAARVRLLALLGAVLGALLAPVPASAEQLRVAGSGAPLASLPALAREFARDNPGVEVVSLGALGSGGGIKAVCAGDIDLALSSRPLTAVEKRQCGTGGVPYARTPFVIATLPVNRFPGLTLTRLADIYSGRLHDWPDGKPIRLILRPAADSDIELLQSISTGMGESVRIALAREGMATAGNDFANTEMIARTPGAMGSATLGQIVSEGNVLAPLPLDGVDPTLANIESGKYPYAKTFFAVTPSSPSPGARAFIDFLFSPRGREILKSTGHLPLPRAR
jgi:phosphate transport system substrate-binding protein